jgi:hypothetical protein
LGQQMLARDWATAEQIYQHCGARVAKGEPNLLQALSQFLAYSDPVRKKSVFFLSLMRNSGVWQYVDEAALGPPVDYHEVRGHLRIGTVRIANPGLQEKLLTGQTVTPNEDVAIRQAVYDAIMRISKQSGLNSPSRLHYLFWNVFRSVCTREFPQCFALHNDCALPDRYIHLTANANGTRGCPFVSVCRSAGEPHPITEHVFETDYY